MKRTSAGPIQSHNFANVPNANIPRSSFDRSSSNKTTLNAGFLYPIFVDDVLPGDTFKINPAYLCRLTTPIVPVMDNLWLDTFWFFVPNRLVWTNWKKMNGEQATPGDSTDYLVPQVTSAAGGFAEGSLFDYFGIPTKTAVAGALSVNALPLRMYNLIWNEWFRDENLQTPAVVTLGDGPDTLTDYQLAPRCRRHDYFTSCLPWPQKGSAVNIALTDKAPIKSIRHDAVINNQIYTKTDAGVAGILQTDTNVAITHVLDNFTAAPGASTPIKWQQPGDFTGVSVAGYNYADIGAATLGTINTLRQAVQIQRLYERDARGGTRYTEVIRAHFGVTSPDARFQRPEYLGGGRLPINFHPISQTSSTDATTPQGNLAAMAVGTNTTGAWTKSFTEHGFVIGLAAVSADYSYQQGLNRMWSRRTRWDHYWPALSHIGEQAVLNQEINADHSVSRTAVFGYQERYAEYRYKPSTICGVFRSNATGTLDIWHLGKSESAAVTLNSAFIADLPPVARIVATPAQPHFRLDCYFKTICARPMPLYGIPGLMDRF